MDKDKNMGALSQMLGAIRAENNRLNTEKGIALEKINEERRAANIRIDEQKAKHDRFFAVAHEELRKKYLEKRNALDNEYKLLGLRISEHIAKRAIATDDKSIEQCSSVIEECMCKRAAIKDEKLKLCSEFTESAKRLRDRRVECNQNRHAKRQEMMHELAEKRKKCLRYYNALEEANRKLANCEI